MILDYLKLTANRQLKGQARENTCLRQRLCLGERTLPNYLKVLFEMTVACSCECRPFPAEGT